MYENFDKKEFRQQVFKELKWFKQSLSNRKVLIKDAHEAIENYKNPVAIKRFGLGYKILSNLFLKLLRIMLRIMFFIMDLIDKSYKEDKAREKQAEEIMNQQWFKEFIDEEGVGVEKSPENIARLLVSKLLPIALTDNTKLPPNARLFAILALKIGCEFTKEKPIFFR